MRRESKSVWKSDEDLANPIMTFPIKKRKLFIDGKHEIYKHKRWIKNSWLDLLEKEIQTAGSNARNVGMKTNNGRLFEMRNYNMANKNLNGSLFEMT